MTYIDAGEKKVTLAKDEEISEIFERASKKQPPKVSEK
jgi:hypothetical protein